MATLIVEQDGHRRAAALHGRVVIGRRAGSQITVADRSVSRIHAWIAKADEQYFVADSGSRTGTRVNGQPVRGQQILQDGDQIHIGPLAITFYANGSVPPDVERFDFLARPAESDDGIFVDCACGAPLWAPSNFAGRVARCRHCGQKIRLSAANGPATPPTQAAPQQETLCGACQSSIDAAEEMARCPQCGVTFHADCWTENRGCSSYGCAQVGILDAESKPHEVAEPPPQDTAAEAEDSSSAADRQVAWEYLLLPASLLAGLAGMLAFGGPALLLACGIAVHRLRRRPARRGKLIVAALAISIAAGIAGAAFSWYWWLATPAAAGIRP